MDARDFLDADGWPQIAQRDRLQIVWLLQGATRTAEFTQRATAIMRNSTSRVGITALNLERDALNLSQSLPTWWHLEPVRVHRTSDKPKLPPERPKPLYIWLRR